jgi:hypothetical protein
MAPEAVVTAPETVLVAFVTVLPTALVALVTVLPTVFVALVTVFPTVFPALWTVLPTPELTPLTAPATVPAVVLTAELTVEPVFRTVLETPEAALLTAPCAAPGKVGAVESPQLAPVQALVVPRVGLPAGWPAQPPVDGATVVPRRVPVVPVPCRAASPRPRKAVCRTSDLDLTVGAARAAERRLASRELGAGEDAGRATVAVAGWVATCGQPRKATIALASTNRAAAPASRDPEVPKPARYARVARTCV